MPASAEFSLMCTVAGGLLEGPRFDPDFGVVFSDARQGGVFGFRPGHPLEVVISHRRGIAGLARHANGGFVVSGRNVAVKAPDNEAQGPTSVLFTSDGREDIAGFNDLTVDPVGRVYVGTLGPGALTNPQAASGEVFCLDLDGSVRSVADDLRAPNGMAYSPDGSVVYVADSGQNTIFAYDTDLESGNWGKRRLLAAIEPGVPDGIAVAEDGSVWVAQAWAGRVGRYDAAGRLMEVLTVPTSFVTSLSFGGDSGRHLYVTTGADESSPEGPAGVYETETDVAGVTIPRAQVPVPQ